MRPLSRNFEGRVAVVTGGGSGIGAAISTALARRGATVIICHETQQMTDDYARKLSGDGYRIDGIGADLSSAAGCRKIIDNVFSRYGKIDFLVNNAGITGPPALAAFLDSTDEHLDLVIDVNLKAVFRCGREAARRMADAGQGVIINIASVNAFSASPDTAAYMASKAGVVGLTKSMALELASRGIRVIAIAPGNIDVGKPDFLPLGEVHPRINWWHNRNIPLGRRGTPEDIASAACFLLSDEASYITGATMLVDGGMLSY